MAAMIKLTMIRATVMNEDEIEQEVTVPVTIVDPVQKIRCFYPRKDGKTGTRITFWDGGGFAVTETPERVEEMLNAVA